MPGRAQSARSDASDLEQHVETLMELKKLERSYRIMEKDRKAYTQESQVHISKQRSDTCFYCHICTIMYAHQLYDVVLVYVVVLQEGDHSTRTRTRRNSERLAIDRESFESKQERTKHG